MFESNEKIELLDGRMKSRIVTAKKFFQDFGLITYVNTTDNEALRVKSACSSELPIIEVKFSDGTTRKVSSNHRFISKKNTPIYVKVVKEVKTETGYLKIVSKKELPVASVYMPKTAEEGWYKDQFGVFHYVEREI